MCCKETRGDRETERQRERERERERERQRRRQRGRDGHERKGLEKVDGWGRGG